MAPADSTSQFAEEALALWSDPSRRRDLGTAGQTFYKEHFTFDVIAQRLVQHLGAEVVM
jgi:glycosyltransferase involved in cell wall biosynthesis